MAAYVVGNIRVKNEDKWTEYRSRVPETLAPWGAELLFRGRLQTVLSGEPPYPDIVVIRFPNLKSIEGWYNSVAYQAIIPIREEAADIALVSYES
ncbi:MAG: DUF1330 domain-containing protein [Deltaproteobacteria bacterium]|nr:DUF1330 domain-containing protein [Deltaproteobacteria bacterium]